MKKIYFLFFTLFFACNSLWGQYALPNYLFSCTSNDYIDNVFTTMGISNIANFSSRCNGAAPNNHTYFNNMTVSQIQGQNFGFSVQAGTQWNQGFAIWIDWNQDFDFSDPGEDVYLSPNAATTPFTGTINVPLTATPGNTRMRVLCIFGNVPNAGSNGTYLFGECEDYNMLVIPATPCAGQPVAGTAIYNSLCPTSFVTSTGLTIANNITYQWQKKEGCNGSWTNINNATFPNYFITSQTQPTYYRMYLICTNSGQSDTSSPVLVNSLALCYCPSSARSTGDEEIYNVTINGASTPAMYSGANACINPAPGPGSALSLYSNFTTLGPLTRFSPGDVINFSITQDECPSVAAFYANGIGMWIDFNADGDYTDAGETVYLENTTTAGPRVVSGSFVVPVNAAAGTTVGMRVITAEGYSGSSLTPCLNGYGYGETEDYLVEIEYLPTVVGDGLHCTSEGSFTMSVSAPGMTGEYTYLWTFPDGSQHTDSVLTLPAVAGPGGPSGTYTVVVLSHPCGGGTPDTSGVKTVTVYVQQTPPPPVVAPLITYCQGSTPDTIAIHGQNIKWYSVDTGGTAVTTQPVINTGTPGSFTYYVSQTYGGCESSRVPVTVQVVPQAPPPAVTSPVTYCQNDPAAPLQAVGQNLLWYSTNTGGVGTPVVPTPSTLAQGTFYWYVTQTIDGCESVRVPVEIQVNYRPNALINGSRTFVCQGDTLSFTYYGNADGDPNVTFNWQWPAGATVLSGSGQGPYILRFDSAGAHTISLIVDNNGCVSPEARFSIEVRPLPVFSLEIPEQACQGEIVHLVINQATPGIDSFMWTLDGGQKVYASETAGPYGVRWDQPGQKTITVTGTDRTCTAAPVQDVINIRWLPDASISTPQGAEVCAGDSILLEAVYHPEYTYQWLPEQFFAENNSYRQWARIDYAREITLKVTDVYNCKSTSSIWVSPKNCCTIAFPSAFTPNSDGRNDVFRPITQGHQKISRFVVKNRWGQEVFETADDRLGWDGRFGGTPQDMGVYFYYIKFQCSDGNFYEEKGEVMLVR